MITTKTIKQATLDNYSKYADRITRKFDYEPGIDFETTIPNTDVPKADVKNYLVMNSRQIRKYGLGCINEDNKGLKHDIAHEANPKAKKALQACLHTTDNNVLLTNGIIYCQNETIDGCTKCLPDPITAKFFDDQYLHKAFRNPHAHLTIYECMNDEETENNDIYLINQLDSNAKDFPYQVRKIKADMVYSIDMGVINWYRAVNDPKTRLYNSVPANFGIGKSFEDQEMIGAQEIFFNISDGSHIPTRLVRKFNDKFTEKYKHAEDEVAMLNRTVYQHDRPAQYRTFYLNRLYRQFLDFQKTDVQKHYIVSKDYAYTGTKVQQFRADIFRHIVDFDRSVDEANIYKTEIPRLHSTVGYVGYDKLLKDNVIKQTKAFRNLTTKQMKDVLFDIYEAYK